MERTAMLSREVLDEDLQIVRVTLATISDDIRHFSAASADALEEALANLDRAQLELIGRSRRFIPRDYVSENVEAKSAERELP